MKARPLSFQGEQIKCGEIEEDGPSDVEQRLHDRFINHARNLLAQYAKAPEKDPGDLNAYMDKLFSDGLSRAAPNQRREATPAEGEAE